MLLSDKEVVIRISCEQKRRRRKKEINKDFGWVRW